MDRETIIAAMQAAGLSRPKVMVRKLADGKTIVFDLFVAGAPLTKVRLAKDADDDDLAAAIEALR